ncbi:signal sequence binding protein [Paracoccidioides lutzii Pb01]|uniref:Vacuolar protein sorting/targeting protein 10 n=1 Tax=Paracoccidioides lutzii (strain ATCC MYA-826 / Pb01) TaxID=502779 RepID=VPS10_PARBA|nr:signal sequence binding protein [Paracoccidioides lutzii Pb01]C1GTA5.1 RecName: Full=Vacuolar protein sorting/targeting protein 10; AltName: Full=Carboxypeptidase Y receptor; Short=CPY receptor; AltName: Full=Sortilin VPS10; AltName: Full=Vacuolar carboxypeptidase sorting receptor VPS10; Flags: Precursor [Paracoccidioides lutzii Pb01]EEH39288.1 signal sequence binding protein [Paracoccidioides lutzii Pb01]
MILRRLVLAGSLLLATAFTSAKKADSPIITATRFDHEPINLFYFGDSDVVMLQDIKNGDVYVSRDAGVKWDMVNLDGLKGQALSLWSHPTDRTKAYILGKAGKHWVTNDQAKSWHEFSADVEFFQSLYPLVFHGKDSDRVLLQGQKCFGRDCKEVTYYTTDGFKTVDILMENARGCNWAVSTPIFGDGLNLSKEVNDRIFCIVPGLQSPWSDYNRLLYSDRFFKQDPGTEAPLDSGRAVSGVVRTASVKKYLLAAAKSARTSELALYVTDDGSQWHRAEFDGHRVEEDAYTVLESTNYSIQIDVVAETPSAPMGRLFTSNSNGTYFTRNIDHTNRNSLGFVDFEKIANIQGIILVNTVKNWEDVEMSALVEKKIISQISFDDGRTFQPLKAGKHDLHLHSVTHLSNSGRVFSSPAPGLVMGVGNTGGHLKDYYDGDLYVSDDAGITWRKALDEAHKYEFGDQGSVIVAIFDEGRTGKISYSLNHGKDWKEASLPDGIKIRARILTTMPDSTGLKFLLVGSAKKDSEVEHYVISISFTDMEERTCGKDDFETWPARLNEKNEPDCLMGHKQFYQRRKADVDCFIKKKFQEPVPQFEPCKCTVEDFECDFNFIRSTDGKSCVPARNLPVPEGACKKPDDKYMGSSGFRLIPGNACIREGGVELDKQIERVCTDTLTVPVSGEIAVQKTFFTADNYKGYFYLERKDSSKGDDETVIMITSELQIYITRDHGKIWKEIFPGESITRIVPHQYFDDVAYFLTNSGDGWYTLDRGENFRTFKVPIPPNQDKLPVLSFHPERRDWLIWTGAVECKTRGPQCHSVAYYSTNHGSEWHFLMQYVRRCEFIKREARGSSNNLVFCEQFENENPLNHHLQLLSTDDWFSEKKVHYNNILDFATMQEFIIVAVRGEKPQDSLSVGVSVDGETFAYADLPANVQIPVQRAYTVLESRTHAAFLHVTVNNIEDHEYGSILKSNSNGTSYVLSLSAVNRNTYGYADFEKMQGMEGVAMANVVGNVADVEKGAAKKYRTMITHNDGAEWTLLSPPSKDSEGRDYSCSTKGGKPTDKCALHLHSYTERVDPRDTYSSPAAIGVMLGTGNVGEYLTLKSEADTFITRDGGITWEEVKKDKYQWEFGDSGSIIVIVPESRPTKTLFYSLDEGKSWKEFQFSEVEMLIRDISTVPSDTSRNFLLWGNEVGNGKKPGIATVNVDFSNLKERHKQCVLNEEKPEADDYYLWEPIHPFQPNGCLFGHRAKYHRKRPDRDCFIGRELQHLDSIGDICECTRSDYECDYNYEPQIDGTCAPVPGLQPLDPKLICMEDPKAVEWYEPTGYRRIPLTKCEGGKQLHHIIPHACPNKEEEFLKKHPGLRGVGLFFVVMGPIGLAAAIGYYVYTRWDGKFGRIRLGDTGSGGFFASDSLFISIPVAIVAGVVAVATALPLLASSLWRSVKGYARVPGGSSSQRVYSSRAAFAAQRADYVGVVDDEDELLGAEDFDEEENDDRGQV